MIHFVFIDSDDVVTSSWTLSVSSRWQSGNTFPWRHLQKMLLLLLQVDITVNTQTNNIINITNQKRSCLSDIEQIPPMRERFWCGDGVMGFEDSADATFSESRGEDLTKSRPRLALRIWLMGMLKSLGTPSRVCPWAFWKYHYLWAFSGAAMGTPGIKGDWCIYGILAIFGCSAICEPLQWWFAFYLQFLINMGTVSSVPFWVRKLQVHSFIGWDFFTASTFWDIFSAQKYY